MIKNQIVAHDTRIYDGVNACTSITLHETDNPRVGANAQAHANLQTDGTVRQASWHIQVDDTEAIRSYPNEAQCWHAGTDEGNRTSVAIEICVNADGDYDKAFARAGKVAAEVREELGLGRDAVVQHNHWTGKDCPSQMRLTGRWQEFLDLTETKENTPMSTMINPVRGRVTSEWSKNRRNPATGVLTSHAGIDIAAAKGTLVVAAFAGRVFTVRTGSYRGDPTKGYGPKTGNHVGIQNKDGAVQYYGHLNTTGCKVGQWIAQGEIIGTVGDTGMVTGPHLHFECWSNKNINSHFNPRIIFDRYGIKPGVGGGAGTVKPAGTVSKPSSKPGAVKKQTNSTRPNGSTTFPTDYVDLKLDKDFGAFTIGALQILLHALKRRHNKQWDGVFGKRGVMDFQEQLRAMGYYKTTPFAAKGVRKGATLKVDGGDGYWFWVAVQMMLRDRKHYTRAIDGNPKGYTIEGLQSWLNTQNGK
ncbi:peptidoglycan DD-metalloendopeptidase family protein [Arthrobacter rhombi]|uniref:peptidoglycan DD-metalloendopeptidase family protein n=1 Tax=Arthrobacter rhombi TaxID=71253 RepID=UPI003FD158DC